MQYCDSQFEGVVAATMTVVTSWGGDEWKIPEKYTKFNNEHGGGISPITLQARLSDLIDEELAEYL